MSQLVYADVCFTPQTVWS